MNLDGHYLEHREYHFIINDSRYCNVFNYFMESYREETKLFTSIKNAPHLNRRNWIITKIERQ